MCIRDRYNNIIKAKKNAEYLAMLDKSMEEAEAGGFVIKTIDELGADVYKRQGAVSRVYTDRNAFCECRGGDSISRCNTVL